MTPAIRCGICKRGVVDWDVHRQSDEHLGKIEARLATLAKRLAKLNAEAIQVEAESKALLKAAVATHALTR